MSGRAGSNGGSRGFSELELTAIGELLPELRQLAVGQRVLYQSILLGLGLGLVAHLVGYWLRAAAASTEPLALVADLLYALGYSLWTGVVVVAFVQVFPEFKRRQIKEALAAHRDWDLRKQRSKVGEFSGVAVGRGQAEMLGAIVGRWRTTGRVIGDEGDRVVGTDTYELLPGGHFLIHHVDVRVGDRPVRAIEIIGEPDPDTAASGSSFLARSYDDSAVTIMRVRVDDSGAWHFSGSEVAPAARPDGVAPESGAVRSTLRVAPDRLSMSASWERTEDGSNWVPWMEISFTRLD